MSVVGKLSDAMLEGRITEADVNAFSFVIAHKDLMAKDTPWLYLGLELKEATARVTKELERAKAGDDPA